MNYFLVNIFTEPTSMTSFQRLETLSNKEEILLHWNRFSCGDQSAWATQEVMLSSAGGKHWALSRPLRRKKQLTPQLDYYWLCQSYVGQPLVFLTKQRMLVGSRVWRCLLGSSNPWMTTCPAWSAPRPAKQRMLVGSSNPAKRCISSWESLSLFPTLILQYRKCVVKHF